MDTGLDIDSVRLNFDAGGMWLLNIFIGLIMFGIALDLRPADFMRLVRQPKGPLIGLAAQFLLLPAATFVMVWIVRPHPSIALGCMIVAACPGGNLSNFVTYLAKGNAALSLTMTAVSTAAAIAMTPINVSFWGSLLPETAEIMREVAVDPLEILAIITLILGIPLCAGMAFAMRFPNAAEKLHKPFKWGAIVFFLAFVAFVFTRNWALFLDYIGWIAGIVLLQNLLAFGVGYMLARIGRLEPRDRRAVTIEVGIQNSALALVLIFTFFDGLGGMALIAGWWGIWHIIAGLTLAAVWSRVPLAGGESENESE